MRDYLEDSTAFLAVRGEVSEAVYQKWLTHFRLPVCRSIDAQGQYCGKELPKVKAASDFVAGQSDRCAEHCKAPKSHAE